MPHFSDDTYIDFCVTEALVARAADEEQEAEEAQRRDQFKGKDERKAWAKEQGLA